MFANGKPPRAFSRGTSGKMIGGGAATFLTLRGRNKISIIVTKAFTTRNGSDISH